ncbi:unnamed protein product, partial [Rotaria socialis]
SIQVLCCWNGGVVLNPEPFLVYGVRFRRSDASLGEKECSGSECTQLCRDFIKFGYFRNIIVPKLKVSYEHHVFSAVKVGDFAKVTNSSRELNNLDDLKLIFDSPPTHQDCWPMYKTGVSGPDGRIYRESIEDVSRPWPRPHGIVFKEPLNTIVYNKKTNKRHILPFPNGHSIFD